MQRENFKSRTGFLLVSAGCAIGIGNVWRFPYVSRAKTAADYSCFFILHFLCLWEFPFLQWSLQSAEQAEKVPY